MTTRPEPERLALVMVGLPARGKTYVARKLERYLSWLGYRVRGFNVGEYRRALVGARQPAEFFAPDNLATRGPRLAAATRALDDLLGFLRDGGEVGIYDATNTERERREMILSRCKAEGVKVAFVESICHDARVIEANVRETKLRSPDYAGMDPELAVGDFKTRIAHYESTYQPVSDEAKSFVKLIDVGRQVVVNRMEGWLCAHIVFFLMNVHAARRPIWLTRHGESVHNVEGRIGGDGGLTPRGREYARSLAHFLEQHGAEGRNAVVWTSQQRRAIETTEALPTPPVTWRALDEIDAGTCDLLTYAEIRERFPVEFAARARDKLHYRYPQGESYADVIQRLDPVIVEMERQRRPVLIVAHQAVLRALYAYLVGRSQQECPHLPIPLHVVIELRPNAHGYEERRVALPPAVPDDS
jgi:broad specificity phosphatase PhoE/predicted kinase